MRSVVNIVLVLSIIILGCSCGQQAKEVEESLVFEPVEISYARGLRIFKNQNEYRVEVRNPQDTTQILDVYHFTPDSVLKNTIRIPISSVALNSTTFIAYFDKLHKIDVVGGVTFAEKAMNKNLQKRMAENKVMEITSGGELDFEKVLYLRPDVFMAYAYPGSDFDRIENHGIPVVINMEYMENHPLGRAEWIKLAGILTGNEDLANEVFEEIAATYHELKTGVERSEAPTVFTGMRYDNIWYAPGSDSYIANYIKDAGGKYVFDNLGGAGSHEIDYEAALMAISTADYWGMVTSQKERFTLQSVLEMDEFYGTFKSYRDGNVFVCNTAHVDYFGDAVMEPEIILADVISVIHPGFLPNHENKYFFQVAEW